MLTHPNIHPALLQISSKLSGFIFWGIRLLLVLQTEMQALKGLGPWLVQQLTGQAWQRAGRKEAMPKGHGEHRGWEGQVEVAVQGLPVGI